MCDSKESCYNFTNDNLQTEPDHYFVAAEDMFTDEDYKDGDEEVKTSGKCANHAWAFCALVFKILLLDLFVAGISCRPFSMARGGRHTGTTSHGEVHLLWDFLRMLWRMQPKYALLENVFGFALPESVNDPLSPLRRLMQYMAEHAYPYVIRVYVLCTSGTLKWRRRRIYISFHHLRAGGEAASKAQELMIQARRLQARMQRGQ